MVASEEFETAGLMKRLELKFHLLMCRHCHNYAVQIAALGGGLRAMVSRQEPDAATLARLERDILADCCGGRHSLSDPE